MMETQTENKWDILTKDHPTVLRRLAKELNAKGWQRGHAFYLFRNGHCLGKFTQARTRKVGHGLSVEVCMAGRPPWIPVDYHDSIEDGNGNTINASRTRCGR
jgi:hypothetical protein